MDVADDVCNLVISFGGQQRVRKPPPQSRVKVTTVRTTGFDPTAATGGSAAVATIAAVADSGKSAFVDEEAIRALDPERRR